MSDDLGKPWKHWKPFLMTLQPHLPLARGVAHYSIGILAHGYPPHGNRRGFADQRAIDKYGKKLFEVVHNIYEEVLNTKTEAHISVRWLDDGSPEVTVVEPSRLIVPLRY